jgi:hypothetical protein
LNYTRQETDGTIDFYVFNISPKGFVIIAGDDNISPIIAYSTESNFNANANSVGVKDWMEHAAKHIYTALQHNVVASTGIASAWSAYAMGQKPASVRSTGIAPLITTTWDQYPYYNQQCPYNRADSQQCLAGCVATAMAQIMKYWNYPAKGTGAYAYNDIQPAFYNNYGVQSANFGATTYPWDSMPASVTGPNTAVATLMYQCGVAVAMNYGDLNQGGSGAFVLQSMAQSWQHTAQYAYQNYFSYNANTIQGIKESNYSSDAWTSMLINELNAGRPIQYVGLDTIAGGHTWVVDGYDENNMFHINWGWSGLDDGYYSLSSLSVDGFNFSSQEAALIGIEPIVNVSVNAVVSDSVICNGATTTISATGPTGAVYSWSPDTGLACATCASTTASPAVTTAYTVTMDSSGFTATATVIVHVRAAINLDSAAVKNVSCFGSGDGWISVSLSGGDSSFSYSWNNGDTTSFISALSAGTYTLTATDAAGCFFVSSQIVTQPTSLALSVTTSNATCNILYGSAVANVTGGTQNFSFSWNNGATDSIATQLSPGTYTLTVTDNNNCTVSASAAIEAAQPFSVATHTNNIGATAAGSVYVSEVNPGIAPYSFLWSNGDTTGHIANLTSPGTYSVTVTDNQGCIQTASATVVLEVETTTAINNTSAATDFSIYPNPAQNQLTLKTDIQDAATSYTIINSLGQIISSQTVSFVQTQIDLSALADGVYFMQLTQGEKTSAKEFIVRK